MKVEPCLKNVEYLRCPEVVLCLHIMSSFRYICRPGSALSRRSRLTRIFADISRNLHFHHLLEGVSYTNACLDPLSTIKRITANRVAPLIQLQTCFISFNAFTIKAPPIIWSFKSFSLWSSTAGSKYERNEETVKTVKGEKKTAEQRGREKLQRFS